MKNRILLLPILFVIICSALVSCKKNNVNSIDKLPLNTATISGKWNVVTDSTFADVGRDNHQVSYTGQTGDYFDFRNDGKLYIKEGLKLDTSVYKLLSDTTISILPFKGILNNSALSIKNLTSKSVIIKTKIALTPAGLFGRKIGLSR